MKRGKPKRRKLSADEAHYQQVKMPFVRVCMASVVSEWVGNEEAEPSRMSEMQTRSRGSNK